MWLIVGLGNPGRKYERNRHNIGFRVIEELARRHGLDSYRDKFGSQIASGMINLDKVLLQRPMEYMNKSGYAVQRAAQFFGVEPESILVVHDDIDLDVGRAKLKRGGGHGGHNGLRSMTEQLGSRDFLRVRCGVGKPGPQDCGDNTASPVLADKDRRVAGYVLSDFPNADSQAVASLIDRAFRRLCAILYDKIEFL